MALALAILTLLSGIIPIIRQVMQNAKEGHANKNAMARVDDDTLSRSMSAVDLATRVQPPASKA